LEEKMAKKEVTNEVNEPVAEYFRLVKDEHNMFSVEVVCVSAQKVITSSKSDPCYLPIAFDQLRKKTAEAYFRAVK
jgi:hypothetical protein